MMCEKCLGGMSSDHSRSARRLSRRACGILLILIGLLWFAGVAGWFRSDFFWPLAIIVVGVWMVALSAVRGKRKNTSDD